jgi:hypothetical protein
MYDFLKMAASEVVYFVNFIEIIGVWVCSKDILIIKIKNPTKEFFPKKKIFLDDLKWQFKKRLFKNLKKNLN